MKKILIIDSGSVLKNYDFAEFPFVIYKQRLTEEERNHASNLVAVLVDKQAGRDYDWARDQGIRPLLIFGRDTTRYSPVATDAGVFYIPHEQLARQSLSFLRGYKETGSPRPDYFAESPPLLDPIEAPSEQSGPLVTLQTLRVQGVKSSRDSGVIKLPNPCVLVGRNGSGKSTLIETLQWLQQATRDGVDQAIRSKFHRFSNLCTKGCTKMSVSLELTVGEDQCPLQYQLVLGSQDQERPTIVDEHCNFGGQDEIATQAGVRVILDGRTEYPDQDRLALALAPGPGAKALRFFLQTAVFLRLSPRTIAEFAPLKRTVGAPALDEEGHQLPALLAELSTTERAALVQQMQDALTTGVEDINLERSEADQTGILIVEQAAGGAGEAHKLPAWVLSEGTRRIAALFSLLSEHPPPSLIAIEEIENGLDPWTLDFVLDAIRRAVDMGASVILTTHSPFFLDKFDPESILHASFQAGTSRYRPITEYADVVRYEAELQPGVMYISDYFRTLR